MVTVDTRRKLLKLFTEANGEFISGRKISEELGVSRAAVWKHMEELRHAGFQLEAIRHRGYRFIESSKKLGQDEIQLGLKTKTFGRVIHYKETVESTQKVAGTLAQNAALEGTIVVAEEQTMGKGRLGRIWHSPKGTGIWVTIILRPTIPPHKAPQLTLLAAVAVSKAIEEVTGVRPDIKWPNDILINRKKVVGILTEMQADPDMIRFVMIGIGMNVLTEQFPEEIIDVATSLKLEAKKEINRVEVLQAVLFHLEELYEIYLNHGFAKVKELWESYALTIGKRIIAKTIHDIIEGQAIGITDDGVLMLQTDDGVLHHIHSADIFLP